MTINQEKLSFTKQTDNLREKTNKKIRLLGKKFYDVKNLFDQHKLHRDVLYYTGKEIEKEYVTKFNLQFQYKRNKESLICWYAENFYNEIFSPNSYIMNKLKDAQNIYYLEILSKKQGTTIYYINQIHFPDNNALK